MAEFNHESLEAAGRHLRTGHWDIFCEVIDNYGIDNYWCKDEEETVRFFSELERPWIAYKVLAAGAIQPQAGFKHAFASGADFCVVGMFDFQVAENVTIARQVLAETLNRDRAWVA